MATETNSGDLFTTLNSLDPRIADITDQLSYAVERSGQSITTYEVQNASQNSSSVMSFTFTSPGAQSVIDRVILLKTKMTLRVSTLASAAAVGAGNPFDVKYGENVCLAAFPVQQLCNQINLSINNAATNFDAQSILNMVHRILPQQTLEEYAQYCPTMPDRYANYADVDGDEVPANSPWQTYDEYKGRFHPNGAFPVTVTRVGAAPAAAGDAVQYDITFTSVEPLLIPPCALSHDTPNGQGFTGVSTLKVNMNFNSAGRALRSSIKGAANGKISAVSIQPVQEASLLLRVLTPQIDTPLPKRNLVPYFELQRMLTQTPNTADGASGSVISNSVNLSQIPDSVLLCVRKKADLQDFGDSDSALPITGVSVNFANRAGILSNATQEQLYQMSRDNGCYDDWLQFSGSARKGIAASGAVENYRTSGSFLHLRFGRDIDIGESFYAPGVLGNFTFQIKVDYANNAGAALGSEYELAMMFLNSGFMATQNQSTIFYSGSLNPSMVQKAAAKEPIDTHSASRMLGGSFWRGLKSGFRSVTRRIKPSKILGLVPHPKAQVASIAADAVGLGKHDDRFH